ncbi:hypothetical protein LCGC14_2431340 [marine sediment metagenome]|uniref:Uncharacterized protein n=1 Tax=marine sediment metagenome TaxID=412755 RepID=A0A0F9EFS5_9ZZZZ
MPYITAEQRKKYDGTIDALVSSIDGPGELNYVITKICHKCLYPKLGNYGYTDLNRIMGVLESVKQEFYRKVVVPYENLKRLKNGPVSGLDA